ncbi:hypothetical protein O181_022183 [Austropuccinia psidii MF-1]|uniref:Uncharacterized protein n=1 Tax=Austropuccinia psidii MF-1 TaxID=1389203 RepID=A0A9Q3GW39_9BASI|nr:hypothetical protein [Austropuccinia psidii MF-1]
MTSIGTIMKEIILPNRKGSIRLNTNLVVLKEAHIQDFYLGTDYQSIYGIDIYNSKKRHIKIDINKEKEFSLDRYQLSSQDPLEELLNKFKEVEFIYNISGEQKLSLIKTFRKDRPAFLIGEEALGKIIVYDIELYLEGERPYPPMLRRYP